MSRVRSDSRARRQPGARGGDADRANPRIRLDLVGPEPSAPKHERKFPAEAEAKRTIDRRGDEFDADVAESDAAIAEDVAASAIDFAEWAVDNARIAGVDAIDARIYALQNEASRSIQHVSNLKKEAPDMAASDDLRKLAVRAKTAEDHAAAAKTQARAELQKTVTDVRDSAEAGAKKLQDQTRAAGQQASDSWNDVQQSWTAHFAKARQSMDHRKAKFDASNAASDADWAEWNAQLTIDYAYSAIEEAEYAVLDAILARRDAEEAAVAASR